MEVYKSDTEKRAVRTTLQYCRNDKDDLYSNAVPWVEPDLPTSTLSNSGA